MSNEINLRQKFKTEYIIAINQIVELNVKCQNLINQKLNDRNFPFSRALNHQHEVQRSQQDEDPAEVRTLQKNLFS